MTGSVIQTNEEIVNILNYANNRDIEINGSSFSSFKNATRIFNNRVPQGRDIVYVKDGVSNLTDYFEDNGYKSSYYHGGRLYKSYLLLRTPCAVPDGHYLVDSYGNLSPTKATFRGPFGNSVEYPFALEAARPPFEDPNIVHQCCTMSSNVFVEMIHILNTAVEKDIRVYMTANEFGLKSRQSMHNAVVFNFNIKGILYFDPLHMHIAITNCLTRFNDTGCYMNQTLWGDNVEQYTGPIVIGLSWDDCCLVKPIYDEHYRMYDMGRGVD